LPLPDAVPPYAASHYRIAATKDRFFPNRALFLRNGTPHMTKIVL